MTITNSVHCLEVKCGVTIHITMVIMKTIICLFFYGAVLKNIWGFGSCFGVMGEICPWEILSPMGNVHGLEDDESKEGANIRSSSYEWPFSNPWLRLLIRLEALFSRLKP